MIDIRVCPTCDRRRIKRVRRTLREEFRGRRYVVPNVTFYECPDCGERLFDAEAMRKIEAVSPAFAKRRKARRKTPV